MLLEVLLGGSDHLDTRKLEATVLEAGDDGADQATLLRVLAVLFVLLMATPRFPIPIVLISIE